jgi:hypothetical protein
MLGQLRGPRGPVPSGSDLEQPAMPQAASALSSAIRISAALHPTSPTGTTWLFA